jgi:hypothetical protein
VSLLAGPASPAGRRSAADRRRTGTGPPHATASPPRPRARARGLLLLPAGLALLAGLDAALLLLDLPAPVSSTRLPEVHGVLLVLGFLGTLVALERAVALRSRTGYAAPVLLGAGGLLLLSPAPLVVGRSALAAGALALAALYVPLWRRQRDDAVLVQALGAVLAVGAAVLWLGGVEVPVLLPWLVGFVVLTIGGERLELARIAFDPGATGRAGLVLVLLAGGLTAAVLATLLWPVPGPRLLGAALLGLVGWLATHDVARRTVRSSGLPRFAAACMLAAYAWLAVAGATWLVGGAALDGPAYDVVVHAVFLGFTMSMVMAHAPVILPAVLRRPLPWTRAFVAPAVLLHGSLVLRLYGGDAVGSPPAWRVGGVLNIAALLLLVGTAAWSTARPRRPARSTTGAAR